MGVAGLAGCLGDDGDDDPPDTDGESDDGEDASDEPGDAGDDATEDDDASDDSGDGSGDGDGDDGTAELTILGETYTSSGSDVGCFDGATEDILRQLVATFESDSHVGLSIETTFYDDDSVRVSLEGVDVSAVDDEHDGSAHYASVLELDEITFDIDGEEDFASGTVDLEPSNPVANEGSPEGIEVEFDIRC